jgi:hypothetical protein
LINYDSFRSLFLCKKVRRELLDTGEVAAHTAAELAEEAARRVSSTVSTQCLDADTVAALQAEKAAAVAVGGGT